MSLAMPATRRLFRGRLARSLFLVLLVLSIGPVLLMSSMAYLRARGLLRQQVYFLLSSASQAQAKEISSEIQNGRSLISQAALEASFQASLGELLQIGDPSDPRYVENQKAMLSKLKSVNNSKGIFDQFLVLTPGGRALAASSPGWDGVQLNGNLALDQSASFGIDSLPPLLENEFILASMVPVQDQNGQWIATVLGISQAPAIKELLTRSTFYTSDNYFVDPEGHYYSVEASQTGSPRMSRSDPANPQQSEPINDLKNGILSGVKELTSFDGQPVIAAYTWLPELKIGWMAEIPKSFVYSQMYSLLGFTILLSLGISVLVVAASMYGTRRLFQPLEELTEAVNAFADGNWDKRAEVKWNDEVGFLAESFNQMADELNSVYRSMESRIETGTEQVRRNAELAEMTISATSLDDLLQKTVHLVTDRFQYPYAGVYMMDEAGWSAVLRQAYGPGLECGKWLGERVKVDIDSFIGWVATFNQRRFELQLDGIDKPTHREDKIPGMKVEVGLPIAVGERVFGVLDVQSADPLRFSEEDLTGLQTLVNQIAPAIQSFNLLESTQINLQETNTLYQASRQISQATSDEAAFRETRQALVQTPYQSIFLMAEGDRLKQVVLHAHEDPEKTRKLSGRIEISPSELETSLSYPIIVMDLARPPRLPPALIDLPRRYGWKSAAFLPVLRAGHLINVLILGIEQSSPYAKAFLTPIALQPYINLAELLTTTLERIKVLENSQKQLVELQSLELISQAVGAETDPLKLYLDIHGQINRILGEVNFLIALYDPETLQISIPYMTEGDQILNVPPFPLGEGLTSVLIRTRKPLMLVDNTMEQAMALGAKLIGEPPKSWLGVPLMIGGDVIGAIVIQDLEKENRFNEDDLRLMTTLASQVAVFVRNAHLLEISRKQATREHLAAQITSRLWSSTNIETILQTALHELGRSLQASEGIITLDIKKPGEYRNSKGMS